MTGFSLIETMRFEPERGIVRLPLHLARLKNSAEELGFAGADAAEAALRAYLAAAEGALRIRFELSPGGGITITSAPFTLQADDAVWKIGVASHRMASADPLIRHKTTRREVYERARAEFPADLAQEVILLNERDEVCEGTITNIFVDDGAGQLLTPPLVSGCLAGVLRQSLLMEGRARESVLRLEDLHERRFYIGNSLRGLIRAELI